MQLILSEMLLSKLVWTFAEVAGEILDRKQVRSSGF
jgi:hypothetical protein